MKVLVAVDSSPDSSNATQHVAKLLANVPGVHVTLVHVVESLPAYVVQRGGEGGSLAEVAKEWAEHNRQHGEQLLANNKATLTSAGFSAGNVETKLLVKEGLPEAHRSIAALALISEMESANYDLVVIGRSDSHSPTQIGGIAEKVVRAATGKTVWVVG